MSGRVGTERPLDICRLSAELSPQPGTGREHPCDNLLAFLGQGGDPNGFSHKLYLGNSKEILHWSWQVAKTVQDLVLQRLNPFKAGCRRSPP